MYGVEAAIFNVVGMVYSTQASAYFESKNNIKKQN